MRWFFTTLLAVSAVFVTAETTTSDYDNDFANLFIGLRPADHDHFERTLYDISEPHHKKYGHHLSAQEARSLLQPPHGVTEDLKRWLLEEHNVLESRIEDHGGYIQARVDEKQANALSKRTSSGFDQVPEHIRRHVSHIQRMSPQQTGDGDRHTKRFNHGTTSRHQTTVSTLATRNDDFDPDPDLEKCVGTLIPECVFKLYNIDAPPAEPHPKTLYGIAGFRGQTAQYDQLDEFIERFAPYAAGGNFSVDSANGGENPQGEYPSGEANLNIQWAVAMTFNTSVQYIPVGGEFRDFIPDLDIVDPNESFVEPYLELTTHLLSLPDEELPQIVSISYGINEQVIPIDYATTVCDHFGQLGLRGVSVINSAGNLGPGVSCMSNDGKNTTKFLPGFPKGCPYVTVVGGSEGNSPEVAYNLSAGGFSEYWARPEWQDDVIERYLEEHGEEWKGLYNESGRAYPDVANLAWGHQIMNHGIVETTGGTSAASPVFGALISLLNNERFHKGKPPMGFLNPWIYSTGYLGFTDITEGKSIGCEGESLEGLPSPHLPDAGWSAVEGWDPITGFGTPDFQKLKQLACR